MNLRNHPEILAIEKKFKKAKVPFDPAYAEAFSKVPQGVQGSSMQPLVEFALDILKRELSKYLAEQAPNIIEHLINKIKSIFK